MLFSNSKCSLSRDKGGSGGTEKTKECVAEPCMGVGEAANLMAAGVGALFGWEKSCKKLLNIFENKMFRKTIPKFE